jgi:oxygen-independent coproporphyrinogen-3 oxidase
MLTASHQPGKQIQPSDGPRGVVVGDILSGTDALSRPAVRAVYVHVPFCAVKCPYCDFYSVVGQEHRAEEFLDCLDAELAAALADAERRGLPVRPATIFVGGGTPTRLTAAQLARFGRILRGRLDLSDLREWTVEANPATVDAEKADTLLAMGVDRISFGGQSFDDGELKLLGREHDAAGIPGSVELAKRAGFRRINVDLIFGLPGQSLFRWRRNLEAALSLGTQHLSAYDLTFEPGTEFTRRLKRGEMTEADPEVERDMYAAARERLAEAGFVQYEISNWARPGEECLHNLVYWNNEPFLGLGPSAAGFVGRERHKNPTSLERWIEGVRRDGRCATASRERLTGAAAAGETAMLMLRLRSGLDVDAFAARTGHDPLTLFAEPIRRFTETGLLELIDRDGRRILRITDAGLFVSDGILAEFIQIEGRSQSDE